MKHLAKLKRGFLASTILIVLTLSFAQVAFYDPVTMSSPFTIADQEDLPTRGNMGMVYDNESDLVVIYGGWNNTGNPWNSTWSYGYNSDVYTELNPSVAPSGRAEPGIVYDSIRDQVILFGGEDNLDTGWQLNDTWLFDVDTNSWTEVFPTTAPSERRGHILAFDSESDRVIFFGGHQGFGSPIDDTWVYNPGTNVWTEMSPSIAPPARFAHKMAYDSESDRVILFGGAIDSLSFFSDTWAYDFNSDTWENLTTIGSPSARGVHSMAYDSESDRVVLFGGSTLLSSYNDTWSFNYNTLTWQEMNPSESPSKRTRHGSAYDWESDKVIIYGGIRGGFESRIQVGATQGKTWAYDVNTNTWELMNQTPDPTPPPTPTPGPDWTWIMLAVGGIGVVLIVVIVFVRRR
ncbi:MAG: Kelch repeat-containing protein [Candidatus Thorarchaeota archaeon]